MKSTVITVLAAGLLSGCVIYVGNGHAGDLQHEERKLTLNAASLKQLQADTGAGKLDIIGEAGRSEIEMVANIYYYKADDIRLSLTTSGNSAVLEAGFEKSFYNGNSPYIDVLIKVPEHFGLTLDDGSGDTGINGLQGDLQVDDGSGDLRINGGANVKVEDGSGDLIIRQVAGNVTIEDGSGDIVVNEVGGVVTIDDGSGDINVDGAGGLTILDSGSGGLKLNAINGPVKIND